jgi:hypothetical protein
MLLDTRGTIALVILSLTYLLITRSFCFVTSTPYVLRLDQADYNFRSVSRYKIFRSKYIQYLADYVIAEIIETLMINIAWRNIEYAFNKWIYPNDELMNIGVSLLVGYFIYFLVVASQHWVYEKTSTWRLIPRLVVADIFYLFMFVSVIILWRIYYIVPANHLYNESFKLEIYVTTHFLSNAMAAVLCASSIIVGTAFNVRDGKVNTHGAYFLIQYFTENE